MVSFVVQVNMHLWTPISNMSTIPCVTWLWVTWMTDEHLIWTLLDRREDFCHLDITHGHAHAHGYAHAHTSLRSTHLGILNKIKYNFVSKSNRLTEYAMFNFKIGNWIAQFWYLKSAWAWAASCSPQWRHGSGQRWSHQSSVATIILKICYLRLFFLYLISSL